MKFIVFNIIFLFIIHCNPFLPEGSSKDNLIRITAFNTQKSSPKPVYSIKGNLLSPGGETVKNASLNVSAGSLSTTTSVKKEITGGTSVVSEKAPGKLDFVDIDPTKGKIAGPVKIAKAVDETEINFYSLYWASAENQKLSRITKLWKTGASSYIYMLNLGTSPPNGAKYLLAVSGNNTKGEETSGSNKLINDTQAKFLTDENGQYEMKLNPGSFKVTIVSESGVELGEISVSLPETITADTPPPTPVATSGTMVMTVTAFGEDGSDAKPVVFTSPTHAAEALNFTDTDGNKGYIAGNLSITKASDETDVTTYAVYFGSSATEIIGNPIAILSKTNQNISYTLASTAIPAMATHLLAFTKNGTVQMSTGVSTAISDLISPPTLTASSLNFSDSDVSVGKIGGILTIGKASDESNITSYALYWGTNSSTKLSHITDLAATGTNLSYTFNTNTSIPSGATHFLVFTKNSAGESTNPFSLAITDTNSLSAKEIISFGFSSPTATGIISGTNIAITVPYNTNVTALVANFSISGSSITVGGVNQVSGTTANNFSTPLSYVVTAADASTQNYTVSVTVAANNPPTASLVAFSGGSNIGSVLSGTFTYNDVDGHLPGTHAYQWYRCTDTTSGTCSAISGATNTTYTLVAGDDGKYIRFEVTPKDQYNLAGTAVQSSPSAQYDFTNPTVANGYIFTSNVASTSLTLSWNAASDLATAAGSLSYKVYYATYPCLTSLSSTETLGTLFNTYTGTTSANITGLSAEKAYYFNIVVSDLSGKKTLYTQKREYTFSNLYAYYPFDSNYDDASVNANHGTATGVSLGSNRYSNTSTVATFNGSTSSYISLGTHFSLPTNMTISAWIYRTAAGTDDEIIAWHDATSGHHVEFRIMGTNILQFLINTGTGLNVDSTATIPASTWTHVAVVKTSESYQLYINGVADGNGTISPGTVNTSVVRIGLRADLGGIGMNGSIDELRIYDRSLTANEIKILSADPDKGMLAYYPFNSGSLTDEYAGDGFSDNGTPVNTPTTSTDRYGTANRAYSFSGTNWITTSAAHFPSAAEARTVCGWIKPSSLSATNRAIFFSGDNSNANFAARLSSTEIGLNRNILNGTWYNSYSCTNGTWYHTCFLYTGTNRKIIVNGSTIFNSTKDFNSAATTFYIAGDPVNTDYFIGSIDDVRIYNRELTEAEIYSLYQGEL